VELDVLGVANSGSDEVTFHNFGDPTNGVSEMALFSALHQGNEVVLTLPKGQDVELVAYDVSGRECYRKTEYLPAGRFHWPWPLMDRAGVVLVRSEGVTETLR
jgi:hypothetical protein